MPPPPPSSKIDARRAARAAIRAVPPPSRITHASAIRDLLALHFLPSHSTVLSFAPLPLEPDLLPLITAFPDVRFVFPLVTGAGTMTLHHASSPTQLTPTNSPIPEPDPSLCPAVSRAEITLALIPSLAFEPATGLRLGHGGGFYDRLLGSSEFAAQTVGVAFACQLSIPFPTEPHDQPVSAIITEEGLVTPQTNAP